MDRVRSAYAGTWALPGHPQAQGQYYFVPEGTAPFESYLWSANWKRNTHETWADLGPIEDAQQYWVNGMEPSGECIPPWVIACGGGRYPQRIKVDMGPVADAGCPNCNLMGGVQILENVPGQCLWVGEPITYCDVPPFGPRTYQYRFLYDRTVPRVELHARKIVGTGPTFAWRGLRLANWDGFQPFAINASLFDTDACVDWTPTAIVEPAD